MIYKTTSIKAVLDRLYGLLNTKIAFPDDRLQMYCAEALEHIGVGPSYIEKVSTIEIKDFKGEIPCDLVRVISVSNHETNNFDKNKAQLPSSSVDPKRFKDLGGYYIQANILNIGFKTGKVDIVYVAYAVDDDGFPLLPDDISYVEACFWYCYKSLMIGGWIENPIMSFQEADQNWTHYCAQARGKYLMPDLPQMERLKNIWFRLLPSHSNYMNHFNTLHESERTKL